MHHHALRRRGRHHHRPGNQDPIAAFTANPSSGIALLTVDFDGSFSDDPDGTIVSYVVGLR